MAKRDRDIKEGFTGMNFGNKSELFNEMPEYKSKASKKKNLDELERGTRADSKKTSCQGKLRLEAELFINKEHHHLKTDLSSSQFNDVVSALVEYKKISKL